VRFAYARVARAYDISRRIYALKRLNSALAELTVAAYSYRAILLSMRRTKARRHIGRVAGHSGMALKHRRWTRAL